jgi:rhodanese-related sulfurtransferase
MGNTLYTKISFQDVSFAIDNPSSFILINTLPITKQHCLIKNTIPSINEETIVNHYLTSNKNINIIVYGVNSSDNDIEKKCNQLIQLGFKNVYGYTGGLFQWLLLQDIYGEENFPTTSRCDDMLVYKETNHFQTYLLK